jgi:hypothetical protein
MEHRSASVAFIDYREMLYQAVGRLPEGVKVVLLADRGFIHTDLMQAATTQLPKALPDNAFGNASRTAEEHHLDLAGRQRLVSVERVSLQSR